MRILSFDTSGTDIQIALLQDGLVAFEHRLAPAQKARQESASLLLPAIDEALKKLSWMKHTLDLIVVGVGPGSFTGVRVSVIAGRTMGQALSLGVLPINQLEVLSFQAKASCVVVLAAGGDKLYGAAYDQDISGVFDHQLLEPFYGSPDELHLRLSQLKSPKLNLWVLGEGVDPSLVSDVSAVILQPPAGNLAAQAGLLALERLGWKNLNRESLKDIFAWNQVLPLYLRNPSVTLKNKSGHSNSPSAGA